MSDIARTMPDLSGDEAGGCSAAQPGPVAEGAADNGGPSGRVAGGGGSGPAASVYEDVFTAPPETAARVPEIEHRFATMALGEPGRAGQPAFGSGDSDTVMNEDEIELDPSVPIRAVYNPDSPIPPMPPTPFLTHRELFRPPTLSRPRCGGAIAPPRNNSRRVVSDPGQQRRPAIPHPPPPPRNGVVPTDPSHPESLAATFARASLAHLPPPRTPPPRPSRENACPAAPPRRSCITKPTTTHAVRSRSSSYTPAWFRHIQNVANATGFPMTVAIPPIPPAIPSMTEATLTNDDAAAEHTRPSMVLGSRVPTYMDNFSRQIWFDQRQKHTFRHVIVGNLPLEFDLAQLLKHIPRALNKQIIRITLADTTAATGALSALIETANDCAATLIANILIAGKNHSKDVVTQPRPIVFQNEGVPIANMEITVSRHLAVSHAVTHTDAHLVTTADCQRTVEINSVGRNEAQWLAREALQKYGGIVAGLYNSEECTLTLEFRNLLEAADFGRAVNQRALGAAASNSNSNWHRSTMQQRQDVVPQKARYVDPLVFFDAENPTPQVTSAFAPCELNQIRRLASYLSDPPSTTTTSNAPTTRSFPTTNTTISPFVPNMHDPRNRLPSSYFSAQALAEHTHTLHPTPRVDVDSEIAPGIKPRVRSTRVGWGVVYTMAEFDKLIELRYMNSGDPFWAELVDELYNNTQQHGGINRRRMFGRPPVSANLWGLLRR